MDAFAAKRLEGIFNGKKVPPNDLIDFVDVPVVVKKDEALGLEIKSMMVLSLQYNSPCIGQIKVGDILLLLNGIQIASVAAMAKHIQTINSIQTVTKVNFKCMRLKKRIPRPVAFPPLPKHEGFSTDTLVLYNLKGLFHLGLDVKDMEGKLVVCDFIENSLGDITFSQGETIIDVDGEKTATWNAFNDRLQKSLVIRNFCLITVEVPATDPLKNLLRNKITAALKDGNNQYKYPPDAKAYSAEGLAIFKKHCNDPIKSIWAGDRMKISKEVTKPGTEYPSHLKIEEKVKETDVPSNWNSRLFVRLPPAKTLESETLPQ